MATPTINLGLLEYFAPIFLFILVFAVLFGVFQSFKILGENKGLHAVIAFIAALFAAIFSEGASQMIRFTIPWFTMLAIFLVFSLMLYKIFGATDSDIQSVIRGRPDVQWSLFIIIVIIILGGLSQSFGQQQLGLAGSNATTSEDQFTGRPDTQETDSGSFNQNLAATFYHPKILGTLFLLLVGAVAVASIARPVFRP